MNNLEKKQAIKEIASSAIRYANRNGYGLGELGPYWREAAEDHTDDSIEISELVNKAQELAYQLEYMGIHSFA